MGDTAERCHQVNLPLRNAALVVEQLGARGQLQDAARHLDALRSSLDQVVPVWWAYLDNNEA